MNMEDLRRRGSSGFNRPNMSETWRVRIMLMGQTAEGQRSAGNIILGKEAFTVSQTQKSERHDGLVAGRHLAVITTADLFKSNLSEEERSQGVRRCLGLSAPGPHVFLWVQQEKTIRQEDWGALRRFKQSFGDEASKYSMVLFMHEDHKEYISVGDSTSPGDVALQDFIQDCGGRYHLHSQRNHTQVTELLEKIQVIVDEHGGCYFGGEIFKSSEVALKELEGKKEEKEVSRSKFRGVNANQDTRECVRMVLVGRTGVGKSATGNTILGREVFASKAQMSSVTKKCQKQTGNVAGREVAVIDTPGLFETTLSTEDVQQEIMNCMGLASPGPHVFLLVMSVGRFTQEERQTLRLIKTTFGDKAEKYTMVLFTKGDELGDKSIEEYIAEGDQEVMNLIKDCGGRCHVFNNKEKTDRHQVTDLFKKLETMDFENRGSCYSLAMFLEAEKVMLQIQMREEKEEDLKREWEIFPANLKTKNDQDGKQGESLGRLTLLEKESGDAEGTEGVRADRGSQEDGEEETKKQEAKGEQDEEGSEKQMGAGQGKARRGSKILIDLKFSFRLLEKMWKSPQNVKETKKQEENDGEEKKRRKGEDVDKEAEKPTNEKVTAKSYDAESQGGEDRPFMTERDSGKRRAEEEEQEGEDTARENAPGSFTEAEYTRLMNEMKEYQEIAKQLAEELKRFMLKYSQHFEASQRRHACVIQ